MAKCGATIPHATISIKDNRIAAKKPPLPFMVVSPFSSS
jgi:hypothetical protein